MHYLKHIAMTKKFFLFIFGTLLYFAGFMVQSQEAKTKINITLEDVLSIEPSSAANGGEVDFHYNTVEDYNSEKTTSIPNSLIVTFSRNFDIKVRANGTHFENGSNSIPVNVLTIQRNQSSSMSGSSTPIVLSTEDQVLVHAAKLGYGLKLDLDYIIPASKSSSNDILGKPGGIYTQTVTYTATAL